jgi:hypothetical protein
MFQQNEIKCNLVFSLTIELEKKPSIREFWFLLIIIMKSTL